MSHGDPVTDPDRRELERNAAGLPNAGFYGFGDLPQMHVSGNQFVKRIDHANQWFGQILFRNSQRVEQ